MWDDHEIKEFLRELEIYKEIAETAHDLYKALLIGTPIAMAAGLIGGYLTYIFLSWIGKLIL
jgi:hypothetical protein